MAEQGPASAPVHPGTPSPRAGASPEPHLAGILGAGLLSAFLFGGVQVVRAFLPLAAVAPFPLALQRLRAGVSGVLLSSSLAAALLAAVFSPQLALYFVAVFVVPGLLIGEAMAKG